MVKNAEWTTDDMPKEIGDYLVTIFDDSAIENIVVHCRWDKCPDYKPPRFWWFGKDITNYVIAWIKYPPAYDKTHNPILSTGDDAWVSQHL